MKFEDAFAVVVWQEAHGDVNGGYQSPEEATRKGDPGGETKYGISKAAFPNENIKALTLDRARSLALEGYWKPAHCDELPGPLALAVFDSAFNQGVGGAVRTLQRALNVPQDEIFGKATRNAVARWKPDDLFDAFMAERGIRYTGTRGFDNNGRGWFRRLFNVTRQAWAETKETT